MKSEYNTVWGFFGANLMTPYSMAAATGKLETTTRKPPEKKSVICLLTLKINYNYGADVRRKNQSCSITYTYNTRQANAIIQRCKYHGTPVQYCAKMSTRVCLYYGWWFRIQSDYMPQLLLSATTSRSFYQGQQIQHTGQDARWQTTYLCEGINALFDQVISVVASQTYFKQQYKIAFIRCYHG